MMKENTMSPIEDSQKHSTFVPHARLKVTLAIASLGQPTSEVAAGVAADLHTLGGEAAMLNIPELVAVAREGEEAAMHLAHGKQDSLVPCLRALRRLGYLLAQTRAEDGEKVAQTKRDADHCRLLIVDDSPVSASALAEVFQMHTFEVRVASTLAAARSLFASFKPTVLVTDVHMPEIDVVELCRLYRQSTVGRRVAVVLVSGRNREELKDRLDAISPNLFVSKIAGAAEVVSQVMRLVEDLRR